MMLSRRELLASALLLPSVARAQSARDGWTRIEARPDGLRLLAEPAAQTPAWTYEGKVPGPVLRIRKGEELRVQFLNHLSQPSSLHVHGMRSPNAMDGVAGLTQTAIPPQGNVDYRFTPPDAGTYWYRPGVYPQLAEQKGRGLYGLLIVDEASPPPVDREILLILDDWLLDDKGEPRPFLSATETRGEGRIGPLVTVNSRPLPQVEKLRPGSRVRVRILHACNARLAGLVFEGLRPSVVAVDGQPCSPFEPARMTLPALPGSRFDVIFDVPATGPSGIFLRAGGLRTATTQEQPQPLLRIEPEGPPLPDRGPVTGPALNPALPPIIKLQDARRLDIAIEQRKEGDPLRVWSLNGTSWPGADSRPLLAVKRGQPVSLGFVNRTEVAHVLHLHGHVMRLLHPLDDGWEPYWRDSVIVPPGRTVRVAFLADNPGRWLIESAILEHAASGLAAWFEVS